MQVRDAAVTRNRRSLIWTQTARLSAQLQTLNEANLPDDAQARVRYGGRQQVMTGRHNPLNPP